jgi:hypothetical protein
MLKSWPSCNLDPADLTRLTWPGWPDPADLTRLTWPGWPDPAVLSHLFESQLFSPSCPAPAILSTAVLRLLSCICCQILCPVKLTCPDSPVQADPPGRHVYSRLTCSAIAGAPWLSCPGCPVPGCPVSAVLFQLSCPSSLSKALWTPL